MTKDEAVKLAKERFTIAAEAALNSAILASPLAIIESPPWSLLTHKLVSWVATTLVNDVELAVFFAYINFNVNKQGHDFIQAVLQNKLAQQSGTEDEKRIAEKNLEDAFTKLIVLGS